MNFRFFGDSWFWTWNYKTPQGYPPIQSKEMLSNFLEGGNEVDDTGEALISDRVSMLNIFLKHMGHTVEHFNKPADPFTATVDKITGTAPSVDSINVVFYSQDYRRTELRDFFHKNKKDEIRVLKNKLNFVTENNLTRLAKFANRTNQKFYLAGGQGTLTHEIFDRIPEQFKDNMILITPCILGNLDITNQGGDSYGMFKFTDIIGDTWHPEAGGGVKWEIMQPDVIETILKEVEEPIQRESRHVRYPDNAHMNATTTVFFLDLLFQRIEGVR